MSDLDDTVKAVSDALPVVAMITTALFPAAGPAVAIGVKIAQGLAAGIPEAEVLYNQFKSGTNPTQAELDAYAAAEDGAYAKLMADLESPPAA